MAGLWYITRSVRRRSSAWTTPTLAAALPLALAKARSLGKALPLAARCAAWTAAALLFRERIGIAVRVFAVDAVAVVAAVLIALGAYFTYFAAFARLRLAGTRLRTRTALLDRAAFFLDAERGQQVAHGVFFHLFPAAALEATRQRHGTVTGTDQA